MKQVECVTRTEMNEQGITSITKGSVLLLDTVTIMDNSVDVWIECVNDDGEKVRLVPDMTGWQDNRKEVMVMNTVSGTNTKLFFKLLGGEYIEPHRITIADEEAKKVMFSIPAPVLNWAIERAA